MTITKQYNSPSFLRFVGRISPRVSSVCKGLPQWQGYKLKNEIKTILSSGDNPSQEQALSLLEQSRQDNPKTELQRLRGAGILDRDREKKFDDALNSVDIALPGSDKNKIRINVKKIYSQAFEIEQLHREKFDTFFHAQSSPWLPISELVRELWSLKNPEIDFRFFAPIRLPCQTAEPGKKEKTFRKFNELNPFRLEGIEIYSSRWAPFFPVNDHDPKVREELLSVDAYHYNASSYESALFFISNNVNIDATPEKIQQVAKQAIAHFNQKLTAEKVQDLAKRVVSSTGTFEFPCGNLFVFCVPKELSEKVQYRAHPFGRKCACHDHFLDRAILDKLQRGELDNSTSCASLSSFISPQYRLYLPAIQPNSGIRVFLLTSLSHAQRKKMQSSIRKLAKEAMNGDYTIYQK